MRRKIKMLVTIFALTFCAYGIGALGFPAEASSQGKHACGGSEPKPRACDKQFRTDGFSSMASILKDLYDGEFELVNSRRQGNVIFYLKAIQFNLEENEDCLAYTDPSVSQALYHKHMASHGMDSKSGNMAQMGQAALGQMAQTIAGIMQDGGANFNQNLLESDLIERSAKKDAAGLDTFYGCESPTFSRLYGNTSAYLFDRQPKYMSGFTAFRYSCSNDAQQKGSKTQQAKEICSCIQTKFQGARVSTSDAEWLANNYDQGKNFAKVIKKYNGLAGAVKSCLF